MLTLYELRCEHEAHPAIAPGSPPRFSWKIAADRSNVEQRSYRIQVDRSRSFDTPLFDSGDVRSGDSHLVACNGPQLEPDSRYFWRVRIADDTGAQSDWSDAASFETALTPGTWNSPFITLELPADQPSRPFYVRKDFSVPGSQVIRAHLYATALGLYEVELNGQRVGEAFFTPGWTSYESRVAYQSFDVTELVQAGENVVGAIVGVGWYAGDLTWHKVRALYGERASVSLRLVITAESGQKIEVQTDESWSGALGPITYSEIYHGEHYDGRHAIPGWSGSTRTSAAVSERPTIRATWHPVVPHRVDPGIVVLQDGPPVIQGQRFPVRKVLTTPRGETVLDFGQNLTGWVELTLHGRPGDRIVLRHAEELDAAGNFYTENLRWAKATDEYILGEAGPEEAGRNYDRKQRLAPHFTFHGFRYVRVDAFPGAVDPSAFTAIALHSDLRPTITFECSNELLNGLHHNIVWGWKGNTLDIPTDCPQRDERLGWTGDAQIFITTAAYLTDATTFFRKWLRDLAAEQHDDGGVPFVVPDALRLVKDDRKDFGVTHSSSGWGDAAVICPWTIFLHSGDRDLLRENYLSMRRWVEYIRSHADRGLLWNSGFHFGDWVALDAKEGSYFGATPTDFTATAYYAESTRLLARAAAELRLDEDSRAYQTLYGEIVTAFRDEFITPAGRIAARTQTALAMSLVFGLVPDEYRSRTVRELRRMIEENGGHLTTGFLGTPLLCEALAADGELDAAYALLLREDYPSWLYQVKRGATTVWEHWDGIKPDGTMWSADMNSFNHYAYGAVGRWIYATIGGIAPDVETPGCRNIIIAPRPGGGISHARTSFNSPYGTIRVEWHLEGDRFTIEAEIPPNSTADMRLPHGATGIVPPELAQSGGAVHLGSGITRLSCRLG